MKLWILFILVITFIPQSLTPQSKNGTILLGGKVSYNSIKTNNDDVWMGNYEYDNDSKYSLSPRFGYFLSDNVQFGIGLKYEMNKREYKIKSIANPFSNSTSLFTFNPSLRYNQNITEKFGFYGELEVGIGSGTKEEVDWELGDRSSYVKVEYVYSINQFAVWFNPGVYYRLTDSFSMEVSIGGIYYSSTTTKLTKPGNYGAPEKKRDDFGIELSFESLSLGLVYVF